MTIEYFNSKAAATRGYNDCMKGVTTCPYKNEELQNDWSRGFDLAYEKKKLLYDFQIDYIGANNDFPFRQIVKAADVIHAVLLFRKAHKTANNSVKDILTVCHAPLTDFS